MCLFIDASIIDQKNHLMADIHVQARRRSRVSPTWMWTWLIIGLVIIAAVVYYVYANKNEDASNEQDLKNQRNTPMPGAAAPQHSPDVTYVIHLA